MKKSVVFALCIIGFVACSEDKKTDKDKSVQSSSRTPTSKSTPKTATKPRLSVKKILQQFVKNGVPIIQAKRVKKNPKELLPTTFDQHYRFIDKTLKNNKGGQIFVCLSKTDCNPVYDYFKNIGAFAGPYLYRSQGGRIVLLLDSQNPKAHAQKYAKILASLRD
jgi:hypothetical protein